MKHEYLQPLFWQFDDFTFYKIEHRVSGVLVSVMETEKEYKLEYFTPSACSDCYVVYYGTETMSRLLGQFSFLIVVRWCSSSDLWMLSQEGRTTHYSWRKVKILWHSGSWCSFWGRAGWESGRDSLMTWQPFVLGYQVLVLKSWDQSKREARSWGIGAVYQKLILSSYLKLEIWPCW